MTPAPPRDDVPAMRERADHLREAIAARAARLRRDAMRMMPGTAPVPPRPPSWGLAAAAGVIAGLLAVLRRRRTKS
jgi:hypothetical protein